MTSYKSSTSYVNRNIKGFTLIELMVVIAIIGIFSAIVLALLTTPRNRGGDANVKANLKTILTQSALFFDNNAYKYNTDGLTGVTAANTDCTTAGATTMFISDSSIKNAILSANRASGATATCYMSSSGSAFVVWSPMKTSGLYWCVDSLGFSRQETSAQGSNTNCP